MSNQFNLGVVGSSAIFLLPPKRGAATVVTESCNVGINDKRQFVKTPFGQGSHLRGERVEGVLDSEYRNLVVEAVVNGRGVYVPLFAWTAALGSGYIERQGPNTFGGIPN